MATALRFDTAVQFDWAVQFDGAFIPEVTEQDAVLVMSTISDLIARATVSDVGLTSAVHDTAAKLTVNEQPSLVTGVS